jgi:sialic acid synthase SpsE
LLSSEGRWTPPDRRPAGRVLVIAEAAQGFEGDASLARLLVRGAAAAGADVVKFQLVYVDELATPAYVHYALFKALEMPDEAWDSVAEEARLCGISIAFDVFGPRSLELALTLGAAAVKIHASDFFNHGLVADALRRAPHLYLSAGGIDVEEIAEALARHAGADARTTLFCGFQAEPTITADNHLDRLRTLHERFPGLSLGFMEHCDGAADESTWLAVLAVPYGVTAIEKHLTLDRGLCLEDYVSAATPERFASFVTRLRAAEAAIGRPDLALSSAERTYRRKALKQVIATGPLAAGTEIGGDQVTLLRAPLDADRQPLVRIEQAVGRRVRGAVPAGRALYEDDFQ